MAGLVTRPGARTQVAFFEAWPPETFPVTFYRPPPAPDTPARRSTTSRWRRSSGRRSSSSRARSSPTEPARSTTLRVLELRAASRARRPVSWTILDLDWRPGLWSDPGRGARRSSSRPPAEPTSSSAATTSSRATRLDPDAALQLGPGLIAMKHGPGGASAITRDGRRTVAGIPVEVVCGLGSGDALTAAFAAGLLARPRPGGRAGAGQRRRGDRRLAADVQHVDAVAGRDRRAPGAPPGAHPKEARP